jgi:hypothetical protein
MRLYSHIRNGVGEMEKRRYIHMYGAALLLILTYNNAHTMLSVGDKTCHCTLFKRSDETSYIRIRSTAGSLFSYAPTTNNPYLGITSMLFPSPMVFTFDSQLMDKYEKEIDKITESNLEKAASTYSWALKGLREKVLQPQTLKEKLKQTLTNFRDEIKTKIVDNMQQFPKLRDGLQSIFKDELLSISNQIEVKNNALKIDTSDAEIIANNIAEFLQHSGELFLKNKQPSTKIQAFLDYLIKYKDIISELLPTLLFSQNNDVVNLAQDNLATRPFRFIYHNIQKLGSACNVEVAPIDPSITRNLVLNKYAMSVLVGTGTIAVLNTWRKYGMPILTWPKGE